MATLIAADLVATAGFDSLAGYRSLEAVARAISDRGVGFRGDPMPSFAPWRAAAATTNGAIFDQTPPLVFGAV